MNVEQLGAKLEECRRMKALSLAAVDIAVWEKLTPYYLEMLREAERAKLENFRARSRITACA